MENHVSFKVYLNEAGDSNEMYEVRRFGIDSDVATSFSYLLEKLKTVFPCLRDVSNWNVYWKDEESDKIKISTDTELVIALTEIDHPIKKLFVEIVPDSATVQDQENDITITADIPLAMSGRHGVIICDGCDSRVSDFRYKCLQCPDFDLCASCEAKQLHPEHFMLRMPHPVNARKGRVCDCSGKKKGKCCFDNVGRDAQEFGAGQSTAFLRKHSKKGKRHGHHRIPEDMLGLLSNNDLLHTLAKDMRRHRHGQSCAREEACTSESATRRATTSTASSNTGANASAPGAASSTAASRRNGTQDIIGEILSNICPMVNNILNQNVPVVCDVLADCFQTAVGGDMQTNRTNPTRTENNDSKNENNVGKGPEKPPSTAASHVSENSNTKREEVRENSNTKREDVSENSNTKREDIRENSNTKREDVRENSNTKREDVSEKETKDNVDKTPTVNDAAASGNKNESPSTTNQMNFSFSDIENFLKELHKLSFQNYNYDAPRESVDKPSAPAEASAPPDTEKESTPKDKVYSDDGIRVKGIGIEEKEDADEEWTMLNEPQQTDAKVENASEKNGASEFSGNKGGAIPKTFSNDASPKKTTETTETKTNGDNTSENGSSASSTTPDPFTDSLRRLLAMGFTNEGNWLRELLVNNKGDLGAVIDQLLPRQDQ